MATSTANVSPRASMPASYATISPPPNALNSHMNGLSPVAQAQPSSRPSSVKPKPANVFSNDGSFLERFQRSKKEEDEKKKQQDELMKKRNFEDRFKNRGKRRAPPPDDSTVSADDPPSKKTKSDESLTEYEAQVKSYTGSLKDNGIGVRPLIK